MLVLEGSDVCDGPGVVVDVLEGIEVRVLVLELAIVRVANEERVNLLLGFAVIVWADVLVDVLVETADKVGKAG